MDLKKGVLYVLAIVFIAAFISIVAMASYWLGYALTPAPKTDVEVLGESENVEVESTEAVTETTTDEVEIVEETTTVKNSAYADLVVEITAARPAATTEAATLSKATTTTTTAPPTTVKQETTTVVETTTEAMTETTTTMPTTVKQETTTKSATITPEEFKTKGVIKMYGYRYTYYAESVLPGGGLSIPGRHHEYPFIKDGDGYICLASGYAGDKDKHKIYPTPFGPGKVYDTGCPAGTLDIYVVDWE